MSCPEYVESDYRILYYYYKLNINTKQIFSSHTHLNTKTAFYELYYISVFLAYS